jgi:hypothetical protein
LGFEIYNGAFRWHNCQHESEKGTQSEIRSSMSHQISPRMSSLVVDIVSRLSIGSQEISDDKICYVSSKLAAGCQVGSEVNACENSAQYSLLCR